MDCPVCQNDAKVLRNRPPRPDGAALRIRECEGPQKHRFWSVERPEALTLDQLGVKRSGDKRITAFSKDKLLSEVRVGVNGVLTEGEVHSVVNGVIAQLNGELPNLVQWASSPQTATQGGRRRSHQALAYIEDKHLRDLVELHLKNSHNRIAHVLYAVAIRGRRDRDGRPGWKNGAKDVLEWIFSEYQDLDTPLPQVPPTAGFTDKWTPTTPATEPTSVLKAGRIIVNPSAAQPGRSNSVRSVNHGRVASTPFVDPAEQEGRLVDYREQEGRLVDYNSSRFQEGIRRALLGHPHADQWSVWISWWVLAGLVGQQRVTSSQLSVGVLNCLRRVDDLAYLRWVARMKNIPQVKGLRDEALALVQYPSDRLVFERPAPTPMRRVTTVRAHRKPIE